MNPDLTTEEMQAFRKAAAALLLCACVPAYAAIRVVVDRGAYSGPLELRLGIPQEDEEPKWIEARRLAAESAVELPSLAAGTYIVLLSGDGPLERFATLAGVRGEGDEVLRVALPQPRRLGGMIRIGERPAGDAVLNFQHKDLGWTTTFSALPDGTFEQAVWQTGDYILYARGGALPSLVRRPVRISGPTVSIDLSPLRIRGVVTDAEGAPVPEATVAVRSEFGRDRATLRMQTDGHGMFEVADVKEGPHSITVAADGYLIASDHRVNVTGETPVQRTAIALDPGVPRALRIVDTTGRPVPSAVVHVLSDGQMRSTTVSDVEGRATVSIPATGSAAAWVIPPAGSFAVVRLEPGQAAETRKLVVPDGSATVTVEMVTPDRSGVPDVGLLLRYNGELLLPSAYALRTDAKGQASLTRVPPGLYEFWPFATAEEAAELIASQAFSPAAAPIAIEAGAGESRATVVVEKNESKRGVVQ